MTGSTPFAYSEEQEQLRLAMRGFLEKESSPAKVFEHIGSDIGYDRQVWAKLTEQLGLTALLVPERFGGMGGSHVDLAAALEETGAALLCGPYFSTIVLGTNALMISGDESACADYLPAIAAGELIVTLATDPVLAACGPIRPAGAATRAGLGWAVSASGLTAIDGTVADLILLVAEHEDGSASLFAVRADAEGVQRAPLGTLDLTRRQAELSFDEAPARLVGDRGAGLSVFATLLDLVATAQAAEQVGGAARCLADAVSYAKQRVQFGRPIASFQAVKHTCADLLIELELGRSAAGYAAWAADAEPDRLAESAAVARLWCSRLFVHAAEEALQLYGGIGVTWEHHAHLYLRRAKAADLLLSGSSYHRHLLAGAIAKRL
jgi:alkylation response protein AidB-like acyl-CoA dehydrogenase